MRSTLVTFAAMLAIAVGGMSPTSCGAPRPGGSPTPDAPQEAGGDGAGPSPALEQPSLQGEPTPRLTASPMPSRPPMTPAPAPSPTPKRADAPAPRHSIAGIASWYDDGPGYYAAAGPGLRVGDWRGRLVEVRRGDVSVIVELVDYCACFRGTSRERLIDLSPAAFGALASLSRGLVDVTVSW